MKHHHRIKYYNLLTSEKLYTYLSEIEEQGENMFQHIVKTLARQENVTEKMKAESPMEWVQKMNNIQHIATEIVLNEYIFVKKKLCSDSLLIYVQFNSLTLKKYDIKTFNIEISF